MTEAPRWSLNSAHYLNVEELPDGTRVEWEHKETARETGRTVRKLFAVPMVLDPTSPPDCNYPGQIIVTGRVDGATINPQDYVFNGVPTPEMEPLNEAAQALTDAARSKWDHPINSLPTNGGMSTQEQEFMKTMMADFAKTIGASLPSSNTAVPSAEVIELRERLAKLEAMIAAQAKPAEAPARRV